MRILHVAPRLSQRGGADVYLLALLRAQRRNHEVHLAVGTDDATAEAPCPLRRIPGLEAREARPVAPALDELLRELRPDAIHVHHVVNPAALEWAARTGAAVTVQDHRSFCPGRGKWTAAGEVCRNPMGRQTCDPCFRDAVYFEEVWSLTQRRLAALAQARIAVLSHYIREEFVRAGLDPARIYLTPPFVHELDSEAPAAGPPCVLFAGRLVEAKGVREAVEAWRRARIALPLVFAGTGPLRAELEREGFEVLGWVPHRAMAGVYRRARAVVFPPRWQEPFGIVGLEALAMGVPVAAWRSGAVEEWHPGGPTLVAWGDTAALAEALLCALDSDALAPEGYEEERALAAVARLYET